MWQTTINIHSYVVCCLLCAPLLWSAILRFEYNFNFNFKFVLQSNMHTNMSHLNDFCLPLCCLSKLLRHNIDAVNVSTTDSISFFLSFGPNVMCIDIIKLQMLQLTVGMA